MPSRVSLFYIIFSIAMVLSVPPVSNLRALKASNPCDPTNARDPKTLRSDQMTVLINGYSESRIPLLCSIAVTYASSPIVAAVLVLWGNPKTSIKTLTLLSHNLSTSYSANAPIALLRQRSDSLNSRFLPRPSISTRAVLICDDDVEIDPKSVEFAFRIWNSHRNQLVGFFARSHDIDINRKTWIYTVHPEKLSIVLTKFMIMKTEYLYSYNCEGGAEMAEARNVVDRMRNCEDILMNFVAAEGGGAGPVLVAAERARDWGDARNEGGSNKEMEEVGLSSRKSEHRKRRGECIREFHRILGRMPLRYSYGQVVNAVGEQSLCEKGGKLVLCDQ